MMKMIRRFSVVAAVLAIMASGAALYSVGSADAALTSDEELILKSSQNNRAFGKRMVTLMNVVDGLTATSTEVNQYVATLDIADLSTDATYYLVLPHAGTIDTIASVIDASITTGDATITCNIGATAITGGVLTVATSGSAAGDVDSASPSALKTVTAGQAMNCAVTGSNSATRAHLSITVTR